MVVAGIGLVMSCIFLVESELRPSGSSQLLQAWMHSMMQYAVELLAVMADFHGYLALGQWAGVATYSAGARVANE